MYYMFIKSKNIYERNLMSLYLMVPQILLVNLLRGARVHEMYPMLLFILLTRPLDMTEK